MPRRSRVRARLLVMTAFTWIAYGCAQSVAPGAPTPVTAPSVTDLLTVQICHRMDSGGFIKSEIPEALTATHLAHGDAFPGHFVPSDSTFRFDQACIEKAVERVTITFKDLTLSGAPITSFEESGFTVKALAGDWQQFTNYGKPPPMAMLQRMQDGPEMVGTLELKSTKGLFAFTSIDLYSSLTTIPFTISGSLSSRSVLLMTGIVPNTFGNFATVTNTNVPQMVDVLFITVVNPAVACCGNPAGLDNIVLKR